MDLTEQAKASAVRSLPSVVLEALEELYSPAQREQWLTRYGLTGCKRRKKVMVALVLREAGVQTV